MWNLLQAVQSQQQEAFISAMRALFLLRVLQATLQAQLHKVSLRQDRAQHPAREFAGQLLGANRASHGRNRRKRNRRPKHPPANLGHQVLRHPPFQKGKILLQELQDYVLFEVHPKTHGDEARYYSNITQNRRDEENDRGDGRRGRQDRRERLRQRGTLQQARDEGKKEV